MSKIHTHNILLICAGFTGTILALLASSKYGAGVTPDVIDYLAGSQSILEGKGFIHNNGTPFSSWPPLFPIILAGFRLLHIDPLVGARFLNAISFGFTIALFGHLLTKFLRHRLLIALGVISLIVAPHFLRVVIMAWSEPLFFLLEISAFVLMLDYLEHSKLKTFLMLIAVVIAATLQRYLGVSLILWGTLVILFFAHKNAMRLKLRDALLFCTLTSIPIGAWMFRNYILTNSLAGPRIPSERGLWESAYLVCDLVTKWFLPPEISVSTRLAVCTIVFGFTFLIVLTRLRPFGFKSTTNDLKGFDVVSLDVAASRQRIREVGLKFFKKESRQYSRVLLISGALFLVIYLKLFIISAATVSLYGISDRYIDPIYFFIITTLLWSVEKILPLISDYLRTPIARNAVSLLCCVTWFFYPVHRLSQSFEVWQNAGVGGYTIKPWMESDLIPWLKAHQLNGTIISNAPDALFLFTGISADFTPSKNNFDDTNFAKPTYIVWFIYVDRPYLVPITELATKLPLEEIIRFSDGGIYKLS